MTYPVIDYAMAADAIEAYQHCDYQYVEAPWLIKPEAMYTTLPPDKKGCKLVFGNDVPNDFDFLVGSAEQGFIQMMLDGRLPPGKYCAAGPCFRDDNEDDLHFLYFFKVELIHVNPPDIKTGLENIISTAKDVMQYLGKMKDDLKVEKTEIGFDLTHHGIEVGSYGCRVHKNMTWIYGTGLALPRFTQVLCKNT